MKKVISHLLIVATLLAPCCKPAHANVPILTPPDSYRYCSQTKNDIKKVLSELAKDPAFSEALKETLLELSKDNKFTDQIIKNYKKAHEESFVIKLIKLPFRVIWYLIKTTFNYVVGNNVAKFLAWAITIALATGGLCYGLTHLLGSLTDIFNGDFFGKFFQPVKG